MGAGGSYEEAAAATLRAGQLNQASGLIHDASEAMASNAYVHWIAGQFDACRASLLIALREMDEMGHIGRMGSFLKMSAALELKLGRPQRAVRLASSAA